LPGRPVNKRRAEPVLSVRLFHLAGVRNRKPLMYSSSLRSFHFPALMMASLRAAGCQANTGAERCWIHGPEQLMLAAAKRVQPGMSMAELERLLGVADYSPSEGQFYFSTGGDCPLDAGERT